jgi:SAM-dependent MidA family methyltransferase
MPRQDPSLPSPDADARAHSERVADAVRARIASAGGWIPFADYMELVLYAPALGYYVAGARKFGASGDFVTAPELTPLFGHSIAVQVAAVLAHIGGDVFELGAGTGRLASDLLAALDRARVMPTRYRILEPSPDLRERQRKTLEERVPVLSSRVEWLEALPARIDGVVLMNEVLDAIPVHIVVRSGDDWLERGVCASGDGFELADRPLASPALLAMAPRRFPDVANYASELNPAAEALIGSLGRRLHRGALIVIDYGFPRHEFYHPQRSTGTLVGHYRHRVHADPLLLPGLSDLTSHVDFTAIAQAGIAAGLSVAGFTTQAAFLLGCGILDRLKEVGAPESPAYLREASAVQKLLSPSEMGELFKVLALSRAEGVAWPGFAVADMRHRL